MAVFTTNGTQASSVSKIQYKDNKQRGKSPSQPGTPSKGCFRCDNKYRQHQPSEVSGSMQYAHTVPVRDILHLHVGSRKVIISSNLPRTVVPSNGTALHVPRMGATQPVWILKPRPRSTSQLNSLLATLLATTCQFFFIPVYKIISVCLK